jgi:hypothetical protein
MALTGNITWGDITTVAGIVAAPDPAPAGNPAVSISNFLP